MIRQPARTRPLEEAHEHRFGLVVRGVAEGDSGSAEGAGPLRERRVALSAGARFE